MASVPLVMARAVASSSVAAIDVVRTVRAVVSFPAALVMQTWAGWSLYGDASVYLVVGSSPYLVFMVQEKERILKAVCSQLWRCYIKGTSLSWSNETNIVCQHGNYFG